MYLLFNTVIKHCCFAFFVMMTMATGCIDFDSPRYKACDNCIWDKPYEGKITARFTITPSMPAIPVSVFRGDYEKRDTVMTFIADSARMNILLPVDKNYTFAAEYRQGGKTTIVINTGTIKTGKVPCYGEDGETITHHCWYIDPGDVDLKLKTGVEDE